MTADRDAAECADTDDRLPSAEAWREFQVLVQCWILMPRREEASEALYALEQSIKHDERPQAEDVRAARQALDDVRALVEETYASLAKDVEPWDDGAGSTTPHGVFAEQLEASGYTVYRPGEEPVDLADVHGDAPAEEVDHVE